METKIIDGPYTQQRCFIVTPWFRGSHQDLGGHIMAQGSQPSHHGSEGHILIQGVRHG